MTYTGCHVVACYVPDAFTFPLIPADGVVQGNAGVGVDAGFTAQPGLETMASEQALLSVSDAAKRLERSTEQVRRYLREGRLQGQRIGGQWFIDRSTLDHFAAAARKQPSFVQRLGKASAVHPLNDVIGIGQGAGSNIGEGKLAYRLAATRRRNN